MASVHYPRSGQKAHIDADEVIGGGSARTARRFISCSSDGNRLASEQNSIVVSLEQAFYFFCYIYGFGPRVRGNVVAESEE